MRDGRECSDYERKFAVMVYRVRLFTDAVRDCLLPVIQEIGPKITALYVAVQRLQFHAQLCKKGAPSWLAQLIAYRCPRPWLPRFDPERWDSADT